MRYTKALLVLVGLVAFVAIAATSYTTHFNLAKPADGDADWGGSYRSNMDTIDSQMFINESSIDDHVADTTGAHAATAISSDPGADVCTAADDVQ
jgi:hypothetical protein